MRCRSLETGKSLPDFKLKDPLEFRELKEESLPTSFERGVYYRGILDFPAIDSVIADVGMFQFTVSENHAIEGVQTLKEVCKIFLTNKTNAEEPIPKYYFVVPSYRFKKFKKQKIISVDPPQIEQYVLELKFGIQTEFRASAHS